MKNVVFLCVDALSKKVVDNYPFKNELFITRFQKQSISFESFYTQGPFTEAALNGLLCGKRTLDDGSYAFGIHKCPSNIFKEFIKRGYSTYISSDTDWYFDTYRDYRYSPSIDFLEYSRFVDYREKAQIRGLTDEEIVYLRTLFQYAIVGAIYFCRGYLQEKDNMKLQAGYLNAREVESALKQYQELLKKSSDDEFMSAIVAGEKKSEFPRLSVKIPNYDDDAFSRMHHSYFKRLIKEQKKHLTKRGLISIAKTRLGIFLANPSKKSFRSLLSFCKALITKRRFNIESELKREYGILFSGNTLNAKASTSAKRRVDDIIDFLKSKGKDSFFVYAQLDDFHPTSTFWTHDTGDITLAEKELEEAVRLAKRIPKKHKCNIMSYLSLYYVDRQFEKLFQYLQENNQIQDTIIVFTSDHGYWTYFDAVRDDTFGAMTEERLHVPCYIFNSNILPSSVGKRLNNYVLPNTILSLAGFECLADFRPSFQNESDQEFLLSENFAFGAPDIKLKRIQFTVHNEHYKLVINSMAREKIRFRDCIAFFDLYKDPLEIHNRLFECHYRKTIERMMEIAEARNQEITKEMIDSYYIPPSHHLDIIASEMKYLTTP